ncbi:MAG: S16 family serine protease [Gaiellales bacterium]
MTRAFRTCLVLAAVLALALGGTALWAQQAGSGDFAFVPRAAQPALGAVELQGEQDPPRGAGRVFFTTVGVRHATVWETWFGVGDGGQLVPEHAVQPQGETDRQRTELDTMAMSSSQDAAEVVGLRALGYRVTVTPAGVQILGMEPDAPIVHSGAALGDLILSADGAPVRSIDALRSRLRAIGAGRPFPLGLHRDGKLRSVSTKAITAPDGSVILGILPGQAHRIDAPRTVTFHVEGVGGPSAGLAFALQIYSAGKAYANLRGNRVAATGTLTMTGTVGAIGGVGEKAIGARRAGADVFLVPADNAAEARAARVPDLRIVPVGNFADALRAVAALPAR